jgi:IclR family transcriptional regulator, KDG regulon repressor
MSKVLNKSLNILELFLENKTEVSLSELSEVSGQNITTVSRMVSTLVKRGYLNKSKFTRKYSLGNRFLDFSSAIGASSNLRSIAMPFLANLSRLVPETVSLISWDGRQGVHVAVIFSRHLLRVSPEEGSIFRQPLHSTGLGKAILANLPEKDIEEYYKSVTVSQFTPNTITDVNDLKQHLLIVKREGVAFNDEEQHLGIRSVAAAVKNHNGEVVGALNVVGPSVRLTRGGMRDIAPAVKACAVRISEALGCHSES